MIAGNLAKDAQGQTVSFPDAQLEAVVRAAINKPSGPLTVADLTNLVTLAAPSQHIASLYGLEYATNLENLRFSFNRINDLAPLQSLNHLVQLSLDNNLVSDVSPLTGLSRLKNLDLSWNRIADAGSLSSLTNLTSLAVRGNALTSVQFLGSLRGLIFLNLEENQIADLAPLASLGNLTYLGLTQNRISDWSALSSLINLANLEIRGNSISNLTFITPLTHLTYLDAANNNITDVTPLAGLTNLAVVLGGNRTVDLSALAGLTNLNGLWLFGNSISNAGFVQGMSRLRYLDLSDNALTDVSAIATLTNLTGLVLSRNPVADFSPLAALTALNSLTLDDDGIGDGSVLKGMALLSTLSVQDTQMRSLDPLGGLTNLVSVNARDNLVTNIDLLTNLAMLVHVELIGNLLDTNLNSGAMLAVATLRGRGVGVSYDPQKQPPQISVLSRWFIPANQTSSLTVYLSDDITPDDELFVRAIESNRSLFSNVALTVDSNFMRTLSLTPTTNKVGTSRIWLTVTEDGTGLTSTGIVDVAVLFPTNVSIPDSALNAAIFAALGRQGGDLTTVDLLAITNLYLGGSGISDLSGLEWASNLVGLSLSGNSISSVAPLQNLWQLMSLWASQNSIADLSPLAGLTNLSYLDLSWNPISSYSTSLSGLTNLLDLLLIGDSIPAVDFLAGLHQLVSLNLADNLVTNVAPVGRLTNLNFLSLQQNAVRDVTPLTNLARLSFVDLSYNLLNTNSDPVTISAIASMRNAGAMVIDGPPRQLSLVDVPSIWFISTNATAALPFGILDNGPYGSLPEVVANSSDPSVVPNGALHAVRDTNANWLLRTTPAADRSGVTRITLKVTNEAGLSAEATVELNVVIPVKVVLPDPNLQAAILSAVGKTPDNLTTLDFLNLTTLDLSNQNISNIFGLGWASNLLSLNLDNDFVADISPIAKMPWLTFLSLSNNNVQDISPLAELTRLTSLSLGNNLITNFDVFSAGFPNLTNLNLGQSSLSSVMFLTNLTSLVSLDLNNNRVGDIFFLNYLTNLSQLYLQQNVISDITVLGQLPHLSYANVALNLLDLSIGSPAMLHISKLLSAQVGIDYYPQRQAPTFQLPTNWAMSGNSDSSLFFGLSENTQPVGNGAVVSLTSSDTNLIPNENMIAYSEGNSDWVLNVTPGVGQNGNTTITLAATNDVGLGSVATILVSVFAPIPVTALFSNVVLTTGGQEPWFGQTNVSFSGSAAAQSGSISSQASSWLAADLQGPGRLSFWWKVSSEPDSDWLEFDSPLLTHRISGEVDWQYQVVLIPPGLQTVTWQYTKDPCCAAGQDAAWVGGLSYLPGSWLEMISAPTNSECGLLLHGALSHTYSVQASADFVHWFPLSTVLITNTSTPFVDVNASNSSRFYRLLDLTQ